MHYLLIGYMFLFIHRPFEFWPLLGDLHIERLYMIVTLLAWVLTPGKRWLPSVQHWAFLAFCLGVLFCWGMSPWMDQGQIVVENYFKIVVFYLLLVTTVQDERKLKQIVAGFLIVMAVYMLHSLREYIGGRYTYRMGIARMMGVDTSLGDPNSFGMSILFALPLVTVFWSRVQRGGKMLLLGYVALSILCILLTGSRSSFLGMLILGALLTLRSRHMWKLAMLGVCVGPLVFFALPADLQTRFETIINPDAGPESARVSGEGRLEGFILGTELFQQSPLTGVGPGAWRPATHREIESHNLYGQIMGEMGLIGIVTFGAIVLSFFWNLAWVHRMRMQHRAPKDAFLFSLSRAIAIAIFLMLLEGNFSHNLFRHNWLWYGGFLTITMTCLRARLALLPVAPYRQAWRPRIGPLATT